MSPREVALLLAVLAAAFAAAFLFRVAAHPAELHDPAHAAAFEGVREALPVLGAVRVRSRLKLAAHILATAARGEIASVVDPRRAERAFRYGRLLYGTHEQVREVRDALRRKEFPKTLPPLPDIARFFHDRRGAWSCDVVLGEPGGLALIRQKLPTAELSGEPVAREAEREALVDLPRALILSLAVACGFVALLRRGSGEAARRLLAALVSLAFLGALGWGVDPWTVLALALVAAAPDGAPLGCGALCLLFPSMALRRLGLVFLVGGLARWRKPPQIPPPLPLASWALLVGLLAAAAALAWSYEPAPRLPGQLENEPAVILVDQDDLGASAARLRKRGLRTVVGDQDPVPPDADLEMRRMFGEIFGRASMLAYRQPRFNEVRNAAAVESLYWPRDMRARFHAGHGRRALWIQEPDPPRDFMSAELYRLRGEAGLRRDGRLAALLLTALSGYLLLARGRRGALLVRLAGIAAGGIVLVLAERGALPVNAEAAFPLLVMASTVPSGLVLLALAGALIGMSGALLWPAVGLAIVTACSWLSRRRSTR